MRKSTTITLGILLAGFAVLFAAADTALKPLARDAQASREMTDEFGFRAAIVQGSKVRVLRVPGASRRLAQDGVGLLVHVHPAERIVSRPDGLGDLAAQLAGYGLQHYVGHALDWVEVVFELEGDLERATLVRRAEDGGLEAPTPAPEAPKAP